MANGRVTFVRSKKVFLQGICGVFDCPPSGRKWTYHVLGGHGLLQTLMGVA